MATTLNPIESAQVTRHIITEFFRRTGISIRSWVPYPEHKKVAQLVREAISTWDIGAIDPNQFDRCATTAIELATMAYGHTRCDVQVHIALASLLSLCVDDQGVTSEALEQFISRLNTGSRQLHPILDHFVENFQALPKYFPPYAASAIFTNTIQHFNSILLDKEAEKIPLASESLPFVRYKRARNGLGEVFGFFIWDIFTFPDVSVYVQTVVDLDIILCYINDLFSFHKEEVKGEIENFIHDRAAATNQTVSKTLSSVLDEVITSIHQVRTLLRGEKEKEVWERFLTSYVAFHYYTKRYGVQELTNSLYANQDLQDEL